jgi:chaperonin GroES
MDDIETSIELDTEDMYESPAQESAEESFRAIIESTNLVDKFDEDDLAKLAEQCSSGFEYDLESRREWDDAAEEWTKLALQFREEKTYPWRGAANVKYPLLSTAAMQFNARAYPSLVPSSGDIVKAITIGKDPTGEKKVKAERISKYMSYQVLHQMTGWEEDMDKLLMILPIVGLAFKKTYFNSTTKKNVSELIMPANLVVDYWTKSLDEAERISEIIMMSKRVLKSRQMSGIFAEVDLPDPVISENNSGQGVRQDETLPYELIEQHCYFDRDGDGYPEPYIVTFERHSKTVLRVVARFDEEGISLDDDGELQEIRATQYYTKYGFIPNPDGSFYDIGFGVLLGPLNESVNTLINQLLDSGHLSTLQAGFLGKGLKLKMGEQQFKPGEWKTINSTADDLKKQILPLPTREPSNVLFQLMGTLITSGKELASVAEIFVGKMPGQNTPATTTMATIEQGMKVFTAVYKRIYRSLSSEFQKLFDLNKTYLNPQEYQTVLDAEIGNNDFDKGTYDVCPGADPNAMSQTEKLMKAQGLLELLPLGVLDPIKVISRVLEAQDQPNWQDLFTQEIQQSGQMPPPPPDPKLQEMQMKGQIEQQKVAMQAESQQHKMELEGRSKQVQLAMKAQEHQMDMQHKAQMANLDAAEKIHMQRIFSAEGMQKIAMNQAQGEQKLQQMKKEGAVKSQQKANGATGKKTSAPKKSS